MTVGASVVHNAAGDRLNLRFQTPIDASKTTINVGGGIAWKQADFLESGLQTGGVKFDSTSSLSMNIQTIAGGAAVRWMVQEGTQWYISNTSYTTAGAKSLSGSSLLAETWLAFNPGTSMLEPTGTYSSISFESIKAVGYFGWANLTGTAATTTEIVLTSFAANAVAVPEPSTFAALAGLGALGFVAMRRRRAA